jgi:hypothetical protein
MAKLTEVMGKHVWCIIINASIIIMAILIYGILTEAGASEIFGTISSVVSIVLGVVVIVYTIHWNFQSDQKIERIRDGISETPRLIAGQMDDSISKIMSKLTRQDAVTSKTSSTLTTEDIFDMQLYFAQGWSVTQGLLYAIVKGYEKQKRLSLSEIGGLFFGKTEN